MAVEFRTLVGMSFPISKALGFLLIAYDYGNRALLLTDYTHKIELLFALFDWWKICSAIRNNSRRAHLDLSDTGIYTVEKDAGTAGSPNPLLLSGKGS